MSFNISTIGHAFAALFSDAHKFLTGAEAALAKVVTNPAVETAVEVTAGAIFGVGGTEVTRAAFAIAGEVAKVLEDSDKALESKLLDAGMDKAVLDEFKILVGKIKALPGAASVALPVASKS